MNFSIAENLIKQKEFSRALEIFLDMKKNNLKDDRILFYLGLLYFELNNFKKSIYYYDKYLKKKPDSLLGLYNIAFVKQSIGQIDSAKNIYQKLIELDKNKIRPYYGLFTLGPKYLTEEHYLNISNFKSLNNTSFENGIIYYLLSKKEKKNNSLIKEIEFLKKSHNFIFESKKNYNNSSQFYINEILPKHFKSIEFLKNTKNEYFDNSISPIFIIGLPRSGSTLVEAILSSSSENVLALGECHVVNISVLEQIGSKIYSKNFDINNFKFKIDLINLSKSIHRRYNQFKSSNHHKATIIDKSLENFFNIESIINIFPNAKFLHTFRNLQDSIISIYQSMLSELSWTHSIDNIVIYIDNYLKILNYYKNKYPEAIMDIDLEKLTINSNEISKKIYNFCNLSWSKNVLKFYKRDNLHSKTLSFAQIRNEVSKYNNKKYKPYYYILEDFKKNYKWLNN